MAAATAADCFVLATTDLATKLYFRAGCAKIREVRWERNQVRDIAESGRAVVTDLADAAVKWLSVDFEEIQYAAESSSSYGGLTIAGLTTIEAFIMNTAVFALNAIKIKQHGAADSSLSYQAYRIWQSDFVYQEIRTDLYNFSLLLRRDT